MELHEMASVAGEAVPNVVETKPEAGMPPSPRGRERTHRTAPPLWLVLALFVLSMQLNHYIGGWAQGRSLVWGLMFTEWALILLPVLGALYWARVNLRETLRLHGFSRMQGAGAVVMAFFLLTLTMALCVIQAQFLPAADSTSRNEVFAHLFRVGDTWPGLVVLLFVMALSPAICEEALFRGALLSGLGHRMRPVYAVLTVAFLFGVYHGSLESLAPTAFAGLGFTYAAWRTNSLWTGAIMHFVSNATSALLHTGKLPTVLMKFLVAANFRLGLSAGILALSVAFAGVLLGVVLIEAGTRGAKGTPLPSA